MSVGHCLQVRRLLRLFARTGAAVLATCVCLACTYSIPDDLPVKGLKLPTDAKITSRPVVHKYDPQPDSKIKTVAYSSWIEFNSNATWQDLLRGLEAQIASQGYIELTCKDSRGRSFGDEFRVYYSADGLVEIFVSNNCVSEMGQILRDEYGDHSNYSYSIKELRQPLDRFTEVMETGESYFEKKDFHFGLRNLE